MSPESPVRPLAPPVRSLAPPSATYRLQLQPAFPFAAAEAAVPYLAALGVSHLHLSPVLEAVPGSTHGYDVVDHARVRAELGGEPGLRALAAAAHAHGLGLVLDIVPNHMAAVPRHNRALWEVLREGPRSPYARWFDIDWEAHGGRLLLPVLGRRIGDELDEVRVEGEVLRYHAHAFPLRAGTAHLPLPALLDAQWYRLAWWRLARTELNYRRFFTISELIGVRVEDPEVFDATHGTLLRLLREDVVDGLRVDHPDGLADPGAYLTRLHEATSGRWTVVEKILADGERLPASWPVAGTTGYDALRHVDGLFADPTGAGELVAHYRDFAGPAADRGGDWEPTVRRAAYRVVTHELAAEVDRLARGAAHCLAADLARRDHAPWALRTALCELLVRIPVYRPYGTGAAARAVLTERAAREAKAAFTVADEAEAVDDVRDLLLGAGGDSGGPERWELRARFAQTASALRAKAVEDTAFYRYVPLVSAAEVGGNPGRPAVSPGEFHAYCARVQRDWPTTGTVLSTHDTKRSAEVRAGIAVLSECPGRWAEFVAQVTALAARREGGQPPDPQLAWATWQTAVGFARALGTGVGLGLDDLAAPTADPAARTADPPGDRLRQAMVKHAREAGLFTSWTEQDACYEGALTAFVDAATSGPPLAALLEFAAELRPWVRANVLGAALLHLTMPGVPDLYQGTEYDGATLVDPDNRRPVRFDTARLERLASAREPCDLDEEKLALTVTALRLRRALPGAFGETATYGPLWARGPAADHCVAFTRSGCVVTAVTRLPLRLSDGGGWRDTELPLPDGRFVDLLAPEEERVPLSGHARVGELFARRPVALLRAVHRTESR
ncbi:malto-oligosyltrehalose synthase [Streptomyces sp. E11-3]|uniref:malto-oligosyltrehalose synthase n=1 Tax=Streptomyces sp. E11-3 TaxID=3110112 RepID=UPI00397F09B8